MFRAFSGHDILARAWRGSAITAGAFALAQGLRLASNLILARLLFPEAFGLMALVAVVLTGLQMLSDTGTAPSIARSPRGDDPDFLNTAWTIQVLRGGLLWLMACALAWPMAQVYDAPDLIALLPVAGLALVVSGLNPTRIDTAARHLLLGRVTMLDLCAQVTGIAAMVPLAWATGSVWALVAGGLVHACARLALCHLLLPGPRNRPRWDRSAAAELLGFGKWIFASTACGFALAQGDRLILGAYLTLAQMGHYNIGWFLASFPWLLGAAVVMRVMIPLYRDRAPRIRRLRHVLTGGLLGLLACLALGGVALVGLLYDPRYAPAGAIVVMVACVQMPAVIGMTYDHAALAAGDSRGFFGVLLVKAVVQTAAILAGAESHGLIGALAGQGIALAAVHPATVWLARRHQVWDARHDALFFAACIPVIAAALWINRAALAALAP